MKIDQKEVEEYDKTLEPKEKRTTSTQEEFYILSNNSKISREVVDTPNI